MIGFGDWSIYLDCFGVKGESLIDGIVFIFEVNFVCVYACIYRYMYILGLFRFIYI